MHLISTYFFPSPRPSGIVNEEKINSWVSNLGTTSSCNWNNMTLFEDCRPWQNAISSKNSGKSVTDWLILIDVYWISLKQTCIESRLWRMVSFHCRLLFITLTRNYEASSLRIILTVFICSFSNLRFSLNAVLNVSLFTQTEKILSYVYVWLDSIFLEVEIPAELCFIKALLVVLSLFFGVVRGLQ